MSARPAVRAAEPAAPYRLTAEHRRVFVGLMLGMFVASVSQTIVGPAMPRIVAELGGMEHYSWVATAAMLVSAVTVPIVGKLSDLYGRRAFYLGGIGVFMAGSLVCGFANSFWILVVGRAVQGIGMGTLLPLSQTIIGDIIPARQRGKYQGFMGAVFGVTSVAGPIAGGVITDHWGWRWLFFATIPVGAAALFFVAKFLHLEFVQRKARIDYAGIVTLTIALVAILLTASLGGVTYDWASPQMLGLGAVGLVFLVAFTVIERRAEEPLLPLRLFRSGIFSWSILGAFTVSMVMFGAIIYIPVYAQAVIGVNATNSGLILMPLMLGFILMGILTGALITRTGHYKPFMLIGVALMAAGTWLITRLGYGATSVELTVAMVVLGVGLGMCMQQYTLVVQNQVAQADMGVGTAATQFFRNVGSTIGIAIFGTAMTLGLPAAIASYLPPGAAGQLPAGDVDASSVLDPAKLQSLPAAVEEAVRHGMADRLHVVFMLGLPILAVAFVATAMIKVVPLRETIEPTGAAAQKSADEHVVVAAPATHRPAGIAELGPDRDRDLSGEGETVRSTPGGRS